MTETPKQAYDRRKQERNDARARASFKANKGDEDEVFFQDCLDKIATSLERIANAMETPQ